MSFFSVRLRSATDTITANAQPKCGFPRAQQRKYFKVSCESVKRHRTCAESARWVYGACRRFGSDLGEFERGE